MHKTIMTSKIYRTIGVLSTLMLGAQCTAQTATYQYDTLTIPQVGIANSEEPAFYTNVELQLNEQGDLTLVSAEEANLVTIDAVDVAILESFPVQVRVNISGNKSVPCVNLLDAAVAVADSVFTIVLAESRLGPAETCIAMIDPFEQSIDLDVAGLSAGEYTVIVNGVSASFILETDN